jgi:hypothetical protein
LPLMVLSLMRRTMPPNPAAETGDCSMSRLSLLSRLTACPSPSWRRVYVATHAVNGFEAVGQFAAGSQYIGVVGVQSKLGSKRARFSPQPGRWHGFRQGSLLDHHRQQVWAGEVAQVVGSSLLRMERVWSLFGHRRVSCTTCRRPRATRSAAALHG